LYITGQTAHAIFTQTYKSQAFCLKEVLATLWRVVTILVDSSKELYFIIIITTDIIASLSTFCVLVVYFMTLPYSETVAQMGGSSINGELKHIVKEILVAQLKYFKEC
jgi:hypothetical protein